MQTFTPLMIAALLLSACVKHPAPLPAPIMDAPADVTPGWNEKEPDTCKASAYKHLLGQPVQDVRMAMLGKDLRIIAPGTIVTQDYDAFRIDGHVDAAGNIYKMTCG